MIAEPKKRSEQKKRVPSRPQTKTSRPLSEHHRDPKNDTPQLNDPLSIVACIRNLADRGELADAITASETAIAADPAVPELHYLRAIALIAQDRKEEAFEALRRVIYLDRSLAIAHFAMGTLLIRRGDFAKARRAFQRTYVLCAANDPDEILPLSDGARADGLAEAARTHIEMLNRDKRLSEGSHAN